MKLLIFISLLSSFPSFAEIQERYELKFHQNITSTYSEINIQDGKIIKKADINDNQSNCQIFLDLKTDSLEKDKPFLMGKFFIEETDDKKLFTHSIFPNPYWEEISNFKCKLDSEETDIAKINLILGDLGTLTRSELILDEDLDNKELRSACEHKVLDHYSGIYHRTFKAANNTFLNNFIGRKNTFAHALGVPKVAFLQLAFTTNNYIADRIVEKSGISKEEVYRKYIILLRTGQLCKDMGKDYKKPRKIRTYLLKHLK